MSQATGQDLEDGLIVFTAALTGSSNIKFDDAGGKITLAFPESEKNAIKKLVDCRHKELIVTVGILQSGRRKQGDP